MCRSTRERREHRLGARRDRKLEHEQRNDDGEHAVRERFEAIEQEETLGGFGTAACAKNSLSFTVHTFPKRKVVSCET
jgi:hypothetical protein